MLLCSSKRRTTSLQAPFQHLLAKQPFVQSRMTSVALVRKQRGRSLVGVCFQPTSMQNTEDSLVGGLHPCLISSYVCSCLTTIKTPSRCARNKGGCFKTLQDPSSAGAQLDPKDRLGTSPTAAYACKAAISGENDGQRGVAAEADSKVPRVSVVPTY